MEKYQIDSKNHSQLYGYIFFLHSWSTFLYLQLLYWYQVTVRGNGWLVLGILCILHPFVIFPLWSKISVGKTLLRWSYQLSIVNLETVPRVRCRCTYCILHWPLGMVIFMSPRRGIEMLGHYIMSHCIPQQRTFLNRNRREISLSQLITFCWYEPKRLNLTVWFVR